MILPFELCENVWKLREKFHRLIQKPKLFVSQGVISKSLKLKHNFSHDKFL